MLQPGQKIDPRVIDQDEILWVIAGTVQWKCEDRTYHLKPGDITYTPGKMENSYVWDTEKETVHGYIEYIVQKPEKNPREQLWPHQEGSVALPMLQHSLMLIESRPDGWERLVWTALGYIREVLTRCIESSRGNINSNDLPPALMNIISFLRREWKPNGMRKITISELMDISGKSKSQTIRLCRQYFGLTPSAALRTARLNHGARLLRHTNMPIKAVSEITGFDSPFHFSREFKNLYELSPSRFRFFPYTKTVSRYSLDTYLWGENSFFNNEQLR